MLSPHDASTGPSVSWSRYLRVRYLERRLLSFKVYYPALRPLQKHLASLGCRRMTPSEKEVQVLSTYAPSQRYTALEEVLP